MNQVRRPLVPWRVASSMTTALVLDALEHALFTRAAGIADVTGLISHSDAGSQYTSVALTERLIEAGADPSAGTVGAALDNVSHSDAGSQYTSVALTERLIEAGADPSAGTVGAALDNALAETTV